MVNRIQLFQLLVCLIDEFLNDWIEQIVIFKEVQVLLPLNVDRPLQASVEAACEEKIFVIIAELEVHVNQNMEELGIPVDKRGIGELFADLAIHINQRAHSAQFPDQETGFLVLHIDGLDVFVLGIDRSEMNRLSVSVVAQQGHLLFILKILAVASNSHFWRGHFWYQTQDGIQGLQRQLVHLFERLRDECLQ